ncbi:MAG TPA: endonuclease/exonuclease/phosphatase family protein [Bryobacteraceae bacterium]|nr:endonuclease/exonuclease/phosphatase family protein [Bryobacteraceae bacterium]
MKAFLALLIFYFAGPPTAAHAAQDLIKFQGPSTLAFEDLVRLAAEDPPSHGVQARLSRVLSEPFISNQATLAGAKPKRPTVAGVGPVLRIAEWNINRGMNAPQIKAALLEGAQFPESLSKPNAQLRGELENLRGADAVILDEVDRGVKRTNYRDVTRDLAEALRMNYVYGVEFIELERIYLGIRKLDLLDLPRQRRAAEMFGVDPRRYLGMEGIAVLSRYPIRDARILRLPEIYDWYHGEIKQISDLERVKRWSADKLFDEQVKRQVRRGGRVALIVDLAVPDSPTGIVTLVCPHLEDYSTPKGRRKQMDYILPRIGKLSNPIVVAGDLNTMGHNQAPTSVKKIILEHLTDYRFWIKEAILRLNPIGIYNYLLYPVNYFKNYHDPTALNFYLFLANQEKPLFNDVRRFRFADGTQFDFAGREARSFQNRGRTLSDSSQRAWKGFSTTFAFNRPLFHLVGHYKLDWFFVKPGGTHRLLSPYFGQALQQVNRAVAGRISDHCPITVDLPLTR